MEFCAVTVFFNPAKFKSLLNNYFYFAEEMKKAGVRLVTVECCFNGADFEIPKTTDVYRLRGDSIMWQKERLVNYGVSMLPPECKYFAWIDCDVIFSDSRWPEMIVEKLQTADILQLFKKVYYLSPGLTKPDGSKILALQGIVWQQAIHKNWLKRRRNKELPFSVPGFAWAAKRSVFSDIGIYDKNIVGSGDTFLVDCYFDSWDIHGFGQKFTTAMKEEMMQWCERLKEKKPILDYLPIDIYHLWHGSMKNRRYMDRHDIILQNDFDPTKDIELRNNVYEWSTDKKEMHEAIRQYFFQRQEDVL